MNPNADVSRWLALASAAFLLPACMSAPQIQPGSAPVTPSAQAVSAPPAQSGASALSYGAVTSAVVKGKTTQMDLIQWFGGPSISTVDSDGVETWLYERCLLYTSPSPRD